MDVLIGYGISIQMSYAENIKISAENIKILVKNKD